MLVDSNQRRGTRGLVDLESFSSPAGCAMNLRPSATASRPSNLVHKRNIKAKHRIKKIAKIARISRKARKLFSGSAFSAATWGHQASGFSDSRISALESDALACTGINPSGRCRTIALAISYGILGAPRTRIIRETVQAWIQLIKQASDQASKQANNQVSQDISKCQRKPQEKWMQK